MTEGVATGINSTLCLFEGPPLRGPWLSWMEILVITEGGGGGT